MSEDYIRTARAKGLEERRVVVRHGLRGALTPIVTIFGLDVGLLLGGAVLTESTFSLPASGKYAIDAHHRQRPAQGHGRDAAGRVLHRHRQPDRGHPVRGRRPESEAVTTSDCAPAGPPDAFLDVRDLRIHFPTDDGLVKSVDGLSFTLERGQDPGHRRRVRLRQERDQPAASWACTSQRQRPDLRRDLAGRARSCVSAPPETVRKMRGKRMAMIFQDPLSAMHPFYTVGHQIIEAYRVHNDVSKSRSPASTRSTCSAGSASRSRTGGWTTTRTSSPAACGSAR